jgi:ferrous iron transport protein A
VSSIYSTAIATSSQERGFRYAFCFFFFVCDVANALQKHKERVMSCEWIPLAALGARQTGVVCQLDGGRGFVGRLASLGLTPGVMVQMVQNVGHGPLIVLVRDTRLALGRGQAMKVWVSLQGGSGG